MMLRALATVAFVLLADPAMAHPPPLGLKGFFGGLLHPAFVSGHVLALLGLGLLIGQQMPAWGMAAPAAYIVALAAGLGVIALAFAPTWAGEAVLVLALVTGGLVALARPLPEAAGCVLAVATGFAIALDSPPEVISVREANIMLIGTAFGASILLVAVVEAASRLTRNWQRLGARIFGSWIAASAILVLAIRLVR